MSEATKQERTHASERVDMPEIDAMPALLSTEEYASIAGVSPLYAARMCAKGEVTAVKVGRFWRINKAAALSQLKLA